jgi:hypothetical protein
MVTTVAAGINVHCACHPPSAATAINATCGPPPRHEEGPAAWGADRAEVLNAENHEPLTEASAASVGQPGATIAPAFPDVKFEMTQAARMALLGWELRRAELGGGYVATRWDSEPVILADPAAVAALADSMGAPA